MLTLGMLRIHSPWVSTHYSGIPMSPSQIPRKERNTFMSRRKMNAKPADEIWAADHVHDYWPHKEYLILYTNILALELPTYSCLHLNIYANKRLFTTAIIQQAKPNAPWKSCLSKVHSPAAIPLKTKTAKFALKIAAKSGPSSIWMPQPKLAGAADLRRLVSSLRGNLSIQNSVWEFSLHWR